MCQLDVRQAFSRVFGLLVLRLLMCWEFRLGSVWDSGLRRQGLAWRAEGTGSNAAWRPKLHKGK